MSYLGDTLTVGLILILLFGSIALYLYTRVQQAEQKISLLESIVLDLKLTGELQPFHEHSSSSSSSASLASSASPASGSSSPRSASPHSSSASSSLEVVSEESLPMIQEEEALAYKPFEDDGENELGSENVEESLPPLSAFSSSSLSPLTVSSSEMLEEITIHPMSQSQSHEYESMSLKELQSLVRSRGLSVEKGSKKQVLLDALRKADSEVKPGSLSSSSFVEASSVLNDVE